MRGTALRLARLDARPRWSWAALIAIVVVFAGCPVPALHAQMVPSSISSVSLDSAAAAYRLRAGDVVRLRIWREPELSGEFPVDESGRVNLPLVGTFVVTGESRESLHAKLLAAYAKSVENLSMDVIFLRRVAVIGALRTPGLYAVEPTMTVGDAIALAGGPTVDAAHTRIRLLRSGKVLFDDLDPATLIAQLPIARGDQLYVPPRDGFLDRNPWFIGTVIQAAITLTALTITLAHK